jgi:hypothetical protein
MKTLEKILTCGVVIALILKFSVIPGADTLLLWSTVILACLYYPLGFLLLNRIRLRDIFKKSAYQNVSGKEIGFAVWTGIGLSIICIGSLFKLLFLMGADDMLLIGCIMTAVTLIVSLIKRNTLILIRASIAVLVGLALLFTSELSFVELQYRNHPAYVKAYSDYLSDPRNEELGKVKDKEYYRMILTKEAFEMYERSKVK